MPITSMSQMWALLNAYTIWASGEERPVNHNNEWGGYLAAAASLNTFQSYVQ
jgi:hypothetical protein